MKKSIINILLIISTTNSATSASGKQLSIGGFSWDAIVANKKQGLGAFAKIDVSALNYYNELLTKDGFDLDSALAGTEQKFGKLSEATKTYIKNAGGAQVETGKLSKSFATLGLKGIAAQAGMMALNAALNVLASLAVAAVVNGITNLITAQDRAIEKAQELQSGWKDSAQTLSETKSTVEGLKGEYETLADGVDSLGNNVSLTADEYARYNQIANQIASMFPEMVQGYTAEGNAIIKNAGSVDELTAAYERLAEAQRSTVMDQAGEVIKGIQAQTTKGKGEWLSRFLPSETLSKESMLTQYRTLEAFFRNPELYAFEGGQINNNALLDALKGAGLEAGYGTISTGRAYNNQQALHTYMRSLGVQLEAAAAGYYPIIEAILGGEEGYKQLTDETQALISSVVYGLDPKRFLTFEDTNSLSNYIIGSIVAPFEDAELSKTINDALDVKELVDDSVVSFGHLETAYARVGKAVEGLAPEVQEAVLSMFDLSEGQALINNLVNKGFKEKFLKTLTMDELSVAAKLDLEAGTTEEDLKTQIANIQSRIPKTSASINSSFETTNKSQTALNEAMAETEAIGAISIETYNALIKANKEFAYALDDSTGYLTLNYEQAQKVLDAEYEMQKQETALAKTQNLLNYKENAERLQQLAKELESTNEGEDKRNKLLAEQARLQNEQSGILSEIKNLELLASTLEYATSAYKRWLDAQDTPEESDIFDSLSGALGDISSGLETGKIGTRKYQTAAELIFGENWVSMSRAEIEAGLKNVESYFTESSEGMRKGVDKLVKAGLMTQQGGEYFTVAGHGVEEYAKALGLGEEATRYFFAALKDYGWNIELPGMGENTEQILAYEKALDEAAKKQDEYQKLLSEFNPATATAAEIEELEKAKKAWEEAKAAAEQMNATTLDTPKSEVEVLTQNLTDLKAAYAELEGLAITGIVDDSVVEAFATIQSGVTALDGMPKSGYEFNITTGSGAQEAANTIEQIKATLGALDEAKENGMISEEIYLSVTGSAKEDLEELQGKLDAWNTEQGAALIKVLADSDPAVKDVDGLIKYAEGQVATMGVAIDPEDKAAVETWIAEITTQWNSLISGKEGGEGTHHYPNGVQPRGELIVPENRNPIIEHPAKQTVEAEFDLDNEQAKAAIDEVKAYADAATPLINGEDVVSEIPEPEVPIPDVTIPVDADTGGAASAINGLRNEASNPIKIPVTIETTNKLVRYSDDGSVTLKALGSKFSKGTSNAPDGTALVGEGVKNGKYQPEIVVKNKTGEYFVTNQPQLVDLDKGDQVINGEQTKKILGSKTPKGGKAYALGTLKNSLVFNATKDGDAVLPATVETDKKKYLKDIVEATTKAVQASGSFNDKSSNKKSTGGGGGSSAPATSSSSGGGGSSSSKPDFVDWIQRLLERLKKYTDKLVKQAEKAIGYTAKNAHLDSAISNIELEMDKNQAAYERYLKQAESVGLSEELKQKVREGDIDIQQYDDATRELITNYQKWYDLANDCLDTVEELKDQQLELSKQKLENINAYYEDRIDRLEAQAQKGQDKIDLKAATGKEIFEGDYKTILKATEKQIEELTEQRRVLNEEFEKMVVDGIIEKDSEAWYEYTLQLEELDSQIIQTEIDLNGFKDAIADLPLTNLGYALSALQETQKAMESLISLHDAQQAPNEPGAYEELIRNSIKQINNMEEQNILLREQLEGLDVLSEKYQEIKSQIADNEEEIMNAKIAQEEWNDAILDLKISKLEEEREELEKTNDAYQRQKELQEALDDLEKAKRQKTVRVYRENQGFVYESDQDAIQQAQDRVNEVRHQETLAKIDEAIDALEDQKKDDNVYDYEGNLIKPYANGGVDRNGGFSLLHGTPNHVETIFNAEDGKKLFDLVHGTDNLSHEVAKNFNPTALLNQISAVTRAGQNTISIGDIVIQNANDANSLASDIVKYFPNALLTELYKN